MKIGVKSLEVGDYDEIREEVAQLEWLTKEFRIQCPTARIDSTDTLGHPHRMWEWGRVLKEVKNHFGYPFITKGLEVLDIGTAYSLIGPALSYLGCNVMECDVDEAAYKGERMKIKEFLNRTPFASEFDWTLAGFGTLHERIGGKFDIVLSISTIEHVETSLEKAAWKEMADLLAPGGILVVTADCFEVSKKGYIYDAVRYTNYDMALWKTRVDELKSYGLYSIGKEDYEWHGVSVDDGSFSWLGMEKRK